MFFKKLCWFTDIHFGRSSNSPVALQDNIDFVDWFIAESKKEGCDVCVFGGDFFDSRNNVHLITLNAAMQCLEKLNAAFPKTYVLLGNHDLYHREKRDVTSVVIARNMRNIEVVTKPFTSSEVTFLPWLVGDEIKKTSPKSRYTFAHLEMAGFLMNSAVELPDTPHASKIDSFLDQEYVFTGHFHKRQVKKNIVYTGNTFPFSFSDNHESDRGAMFLEWGGHPQFRSWPNQPLFRTMKLSEVLDSPDKVLCPKLTARVTMDIDISYEEAQLIKETFVDSHDLRRVELIPAPKNDVSDGSIDAAIFQSVDQIVVDGLMSIESVGMKPEKLVEIYRSIGG